MTDTLAAAAALVRAELNAAVPAPALLQRLQVPGPTDELYRSLAAAVAAMHWLSYQSQLRQEVLSAAGGYEVRICCAVTMLPSISVELALQLADVDSIAAFAVKVASGNGAFKTWVKTWRPHLLTSSISCCADGAQ